MTTVARSDRLVLPAGLIRQRLIAHLDAALSGGVALVLAPAGFGKTALLEQYGQAHPGPVARYRANLADAVAGRTAGRLAAAVRTALGLPPPAEDSADPDPLAELHPPATRDLLLLVDNLDCLVGTPGEAAIERLLANRPSGLRIVLAGRRMAAVNLLRHEVSSGAQVIGPEQLRFRAWEVERLLSTVYAEPLPSAEVALLTRHTEGWAAGLAMFHLSTRGRPLQVRRRAVAALSGHWAVADDYLARTVLAGLTDEVRSFLVRTSVFDLLAGERCDRLLDTAGSGRRLEELVQLGLPVIADGGGAYRYHQVLRGHLMVALDEQYGAVGARRWHARAAGLLAAEGAYAEAVRSFARAEDWPAVRDLLAEAGAEVVDALDGSWDELLPDWLVAESHWLAYARARRHLGHGQLAAAIEAYRQAETLCGDGEPRQRYARERRIAAIWQAEEQLNRTHWSSWLRAATRRHPAAVAGEALALPGAEGELVRLVAELLAGNVGEALRQQAGDAHRLEVSPAALTLRILRAGLRLIGLQPGEPASRHSFADVELDQFAEEAEAIGVPWLTRMARAARALGPDIDAVAEAYVVAGECERLGDRWGHVLATMIACVHEQRFGKPDPRRLARLISECRELGAGVLEAWAQGYLALAATAEGLPDADVEARAAAMLAGAAGVPGVHVAATVARARLDPRRRAALLCEADALASAAGMPSGVVRLWAGPDRDTSAPAVVTQRTPPVSIRCFGGFRMAIGGHPVETAAVRARARAALRLLAMQAGQVVHREVIIDALWPGLPPAAATRNLQVTISTLRGLLEPGSGRGKAQLLVRTGDAYGIAVPLDGWADTLEFTAAVHRWNQVRHGGDRAAELAALRAAMAAYGGDLLPEDGPAEWVVEPRERLRRQATRVAGALAAAELADGDTSAAIAAAEYCVTSLDPHDDEAWQVLLRAYPASNSPARAADARRRYRQMLDSLGIATGVLAAAPVRAADRVLSHARRPPPPRSPVDVRAPLRRPT